MVRMISPSLALRLTVDQHQEGSADATIAFRLPAWVLCVRRGIQDGTH